MPLLPPIDQWGYLPFPVHRLTPHSLSRRVRDLLAGDLGAHRDLPVDTDDQPETPTPVEVPTPRAVYTRADAQRAWARRRADLADIAGVDGIFNPDRRPGEGTPTTNRGHPGRGNRPIASPISVDAGATMPHVVTLVTDDLNRVRARGVVGKGCQQ